jgi:NAD-dependent DNA ligase
MESTRTPGWMTGLLVIFSLAAATTFGLFLYRHAEKAAALEVHNQLNYEVKWLREQLGKTEAEVAPLDNQIAMRRILSKTLKDADAQAIDDVGRLVSQNQINVKAIEEAVRKQTQTYQDLLRDAKERRTELASEETRAFANEKDFDDRRATIRAKIETLSQEVEQIRKLGRKENAVRDTRIVELEDRVRQLTQQRNYNAKELRPDGQLLQASSSDGYVILNIGQEQHLRKGTRFTVYNHHAGKAVMKGIIEVTRVEERIATARVLEETNKNNPLLAHDYITNPVYNPNKVIGFAVRGDFAKYSKDELKRFIEENGGRFDAELSVNTDFLVAGERAPEALEQAVKLGISILSEEQLIESQLFRLLGSGSEVR